MKPFLKFFLYPLLFCLAGCGKYDHLPPIIRATAPYNFQIFKGGQVVNIRANITDNEGITSVRLHVIDNITQLLVIDQEEHPEETAFNLNQTFPTLSGKSYTIQLSALDYNDNMTSVQMTVSAK